MENPIPLEKKNLPTEESKTVEDVAQPPSDELNTEISGGELNEVGPPVVVSRVASVAPVESKAIPPPAMKGVFGGLNDFSMLLSNTLGGMDTNISSLHQTLTDAMNLISTLKSQLEKQSEFHFSQNYLFCMILTDIFSLHSCFNSFT